MATTGEIVFSLHRYNPRRAARGVEAAEVRLVDGGEEFFLWMSQTDIRKNIEEFGPQQGLLDAAEAYRRNVDFPAVVRN